jgi:hypothetical protein
MTIKKFYAGIGSRETPNDVLKSMREIARKLYRNGYILRSGGASGADMAFAVGAAEASLGDSGIPYKIYLPSAKFNGHKHNPSRGFLDSSTSPTWQKALEIVDIYHPAPERLTEYARKLMARNAYQILSTTLNNPVDFVICWTKGGKEIGGTAQAMKIARAFEVPIYNLALVDDVKRLHKEVLDSE